MQCESNREPLSPEKGVRKSLADWRKRMLSDVVYELHFDIPENKSDSIDAALTLRFELKKNTQDLLLDFQAAPQQLRSITVNEQSTTPVLEAEHVRVPQSLLQKGSNEIKIEFIAGDLSLNRNDDFLYTLLVPDRARTLFPCFDQPNLKARFQLSLLIPSSWDALANGSLLKEEEQAAKKLLRFKETAPISTYLFAFTAGDYQRASIVQDGRSMSMLYRESDSLKVAQNQEEIFSLHTQALSWLEDYTDLAMPFEKFDFALIPGFQYGGMEHVGAIFYRESSLMLDENASENQRIGRASLIAHETAHMWFGDLVTMEWFDDVWLKEVFANFMAAKVVNPAFPDIDHDLNFLLRHHPAAYGEDRSDGTHPIQQQLSNLNEAGTLYGRIIYQKAPVVMRMLEEKIGEQALRDGLRKYLQEFAFANASWDDLIQILDESTTEDLAAWSTVWVKRAGMPTFRLERSIDEGAEHTTLRYLPAPSDSLFRSQQIRLAIFYADSIVEQSLQLDASKIKENYLRFEGRPKAIASHASPASYGYFPLDAQSSKWFLQHISEVASPVHRGAIWLSLNEDFLRGQIEPAVYFQALAQQIGREQNALLQNYILAQLENVYWRFLSAEQRAELGPPVEESLRNAMEEVVNPSVALTFFRTYYAIAERPASVQHMLKVWKSQQIRSDLLLSEQEAIELMAALAIRLPDQAKGLIEQQQQRTTSEDRRRRLQYLAPALSPEKAERDRFFASLKQVENRATEPWTVDAVAYLHHPLRAKEAIGYLQPSLALMQEIQATGDIFFPRQFITATLNGHSSMEAAGIVRQFLETRPNYPPRLKRKILMAADMVFRAASR